MSKCILCPRGCGADRRSEKGSCGIGGETGVKVSRAALHYWEEPCISGDRGSGTVFFSGCTLGCVYCQNREISRGNAGVEISKERLKQIFLELQDKGAHNINLVTPDHYAVETVCAVREAKAEGLTIPIIINTGGYISQRQYSLFREIADIWLTDFKYSDSGVAGRYSFAEDYPRVADAALERMVEDIGMPCYDSEGMMTRGIIVRILLLPGQVEDAKRTVKNIYEKYGDRVVLSLMNQYTPPAEGLPEYPELERTVTDEEYDELCDFALSLGIEDAFVQEGGTQEESFIPPFDLEGVLK